MTPLVKIATMVVGLAVITTMVLPGRQTPAVLLAGEKLASGVLGTAMGTR